MHPRHIPFLRLFLPWACGIAAGAWLEVPVPGLVYGLIAAGILLVGTPRMRYAYQFRWVYGVLLALTLAGLGYWHVLEHDERRQTQHFKHFDPAPDLFTGRIIDAPRKGLRLKVTLQLETAGTATDSLQLCSGNVLLFLQPTPAAVNLRYGDRIWVQARTSPTEKAKNPHAFDYRQYLHYQNIHYQAFVADSAFGLINRGNGHFLWQLAFQWREQLLGVLHQHFPGQDEYAVASALMLGYKDELSDELRTTYAQTGSMHALAVSGTHVGLLYLGLLFVLRQIPWRGQYRRWGETALVLLGIWAFTLVTGATASVLRASVMFTVYLLSKAIRRQSSTWNILGVSAFGLLFLNPYFLFDAGFQLSYSAVAGIVFFYPQLQRITPALPKWATEGWKILLIGLAAQLGTLPLSLYYFHQFPVYFWLAGWVVVLGGAVFLWGGSVLVLLSSFAPGLAAYLGAGLYHLLWGMNALIRGIQQLPGSVVSGIWINAWAAAALGLFLWLIAWAIEQRAAKPLLVALSCFFALGLGHFCWRTQAIVQQKITLYDTNRNFLMDFFSGENCFRWSDSLLSTRQEQFAAQAHRWACGIREIQPVQQEENAALTSPASSLQFLGTKFIVIQSPGITVPRGDQAPQPIDVLILHGNPKVRIRDCLERYSCKLVVFSAGNSPKRAERWEKECQALGIPCFNVRAQGAWTCVLNPGSGAPFFKIF